MVFVMKKSEFRLFRKIFPLILFCVALMGFLFETGQAVQTVNFHADLFENRGRYQDKTIVLDPGHGGEDGGAVGVNGAYEKDINLAVALMLEQKLEAAGFQIIMTRDTDTLIGDTALPSISQRKRSDTLKRFEIASEYPDALFVSIHQNYFTQSKYHGAQVFYSGNHQDSSRLAEMIRSSIVESTQPENTRQNKQAEKNIYILYHLEIPAVLVECGFLTNQEEAQKLVREDYQQQLADAIYNGILRYYETDTKPSGPEENSAEGDSTENSASLG